LVNGHTFFHGNLRNLASVARDHVEKTTGRHKHANRPRLLWNLYGEYDHCENNHGNKCNEKRSASTWWSGYADLPEQSVPGSRHRASSEKSRVLILRHFPAPNPCNGAHANRIMILAAIATPISRSSALILVKKYFAEICLYALTFEVQ
jgi:hypothetical protein